MFFCVAMANSVCGGMKTLAMSMGRAGAKADILADTHQQTHSLKPKWTDQTPSIKFNAPVITEMGDMPIEPYAPTPSTEKFASAKWVIDCIMDWTGNFSDFARNAIKQQSDTKHGNSDWSSQWDGKLDDEVKRAIACHMEAGKYDDLPEPLSPKQQWEIPYTMQLAIVPADDKFHVVKHFMFENKQILRHVQNRLARGVLYLPCWWQHNPHATKKIFQRIWENLGGFQVRYCVWPGDTDADLPFEPEKIAAGYAFMRRMGPTGNSDGQFHEWVDTWTNAPDSKIFWWPEGKCKSFLADRARGQSTARTVDFNFTTYKDMKPWFLDLVLKSKVGTHKEHGILWIGVSETGEKAWVPKGTGSKFPFSGSMKKDALT